MIKKTLRILPAAATVVALALGACSPEGRKNKAEMTMADSIPENVELESYIYDVIAKAHGDSLAAFPDSVMKWRLVGDGVLPKRIGDNDLKQLRDTLMRLAQVAYDDNSKGSSRFTASTSGSEGEFSLTEENPASDPYANTNVNSLSVDLMSPYLIVWERYVYNYFWGAAHGDYSTNYINYSTVDNKVLALSDLFVKGYEPQLLEIVREKLKENETNLIVAADEVPLSDIFRIRANGISMVYPLYSIAPYSEGEIRVDLSVYDLDGLLTQRALEMILGPQARE